MRVVTEPVDSGRAEPVVSRDRKCDSWAHSSEFLDAHALVEFRHAGAAIRLGNLDAHKLELTQCRDELDREVLRLIPLEHVGLNLGLCELSDRSHEHLLVRADLEFCEGHKIIGIGRKRPAGV